MLLKGRTAIAGFSICSGCAGFLFLLPGAAGVIQIDAVNANRLLDIVKRLLAHILEGEVEPIANMIRTGPEIVMPPGVAMLSKRAATLTPSPKISSPCTMTSPTLTPMRSSMR